METSDRALCLYIDTHISVYVHTYIFLFKSVCVYTYICSYKFCVYMHTYLKRGQERPGFYGYRYIVK